MSSMQFFQSREGVTIGLNSRILPLEQALIELLPALDSKKGILLSSGFDYPGRHSRWDIAFVDPALEFISIARSFQLRALNAQGKALLPLVHEHLVDHPHIAQLECDEDELRGQVATVAEFFTEEQRSRQPSVFSVLRSLIDLFRTEHPLAEHFGLYGAFGYDLVLQFEALNLHHARSGTQADCHLYLPLELTVVDRKRETAFALEYSVQLSDGRYTHEFSGGGSTHTPTPQEPQAEGLQCDHQPGEFARKVAEVIEGTKRGDYFEVVLSQEFSAPFAGKPSDLFSTLSKLNPSPYMFLMNLGQEQLIGASPEIYARVDGSHYETCPIAGTVRRGETPLEDAAKVKELIGSVKDESELTMCTDVDRNDMARVCIPGSVEILGRRQLEFYSHLIHTVDHLRGELRPEFDALDAFQTHMWACTVTGAPKPAALQTIERLENSPRAWYSGAIGMLGFQGSLNTGILLRTASLKNGRAVIRAGATLLHDSDPEMEERETRTKAAAFLSALAETKQKTVKKSTRLQPARVKRNVLLVDCKDSFIHMLASYLRELGADVNTVRSGFPLEVLERMKPDLVLFSPGPGTPGEFGVPSLVETLIARHIPIFGVCLGYQGIGEHFGATLGQLPTPMHGKPTVVQHNNSPLFEGVPETFTVGRYHSLYLLHDSLPEALECSASCIRVDEDGSEEIIPMALQHRSLPIAGVQFHPESLMTMHGAAGHRILRNVLNHLT